MNTAKYTDTVVLFPLTIERHCNGSRPNQGHIKRQHSVKEKKQCLKPDKPTIIYTTELQLFCSSFNIQFPL